MHLYDLIRERKQSLGYKKETNVLDQIARSEIPQSSSNNIKASPAEQIKNTSYRNKDGNLLHLNYEQLFSRVTEKFNDLVPGLAEKNKITAKDFQGRLNAFQNSYDRLKDFFKYRFKEVTQKENLLNKYQNINQENAPFTKDKMKASFNHQIEALESVNEILFEMVDSLEEANKSFSLNKNQVQKLRDRTSKLVHDTRDKEKTSELSNKFIENYKTLKELEEEDSGQSKEAKQLKKR